MGICDKGCSYHSRVGSSEGAGQNLQRPTDLILPDRKYLLKSPEHPDTEPVLGEHMCHALMNEKISVPING